MMLVDKKDDASLVRAAGAAACAAGGVRRLAGASYI